MRIKGSSRALAMALDDNGRWCWLDPKLGAMHAVAEAARNVSCTGATPVAATNCLNFGNPEKPQIMWQFSQVVDGLTAACEALETPITGGNVSLYNETLGEGIYPTPVVGVVGILEDINFAMTCHFRKAGRDVLILSGSPVPNAATAEIEIGSSEYAKAVLGEIWGTPPALDLKQEVALQKCLRGLIQQRSLESAHDCSDGGLAVALAESAFATGVGAEIELTSKSPLLEAVLFGESASRILISCDPGNTANIQQLAVKWGLSADRIGRTVPENLSVKINGNVAIAASVSELKQVWETALAESLHAEAPEFLQTN
jgi:phosphoribosylformylglycinamidine synthase